MDGKTARLIAGTGLRVAQADHVPDGQGLRLGDTLYLSPKTYRAVMDALAADKRPVTHEESLRRAARANPADDTVRLALADWCDENDRPAEALELRRAVALAKVCAAPAEDRWRLEYADLCERYGEAARAEFIRVQVELAGVKYEGCCDRNGNGLEKDGTGLRVVRCGCRRSNLIHRERELWGGQADGLGRRMLDELPGPLRHQGWSVALRDCFRRGFVENVTCSAAAWLAGAADALAAAPIRRVTLTTPPRVLHFPSPCDGRIGCSLDVPGAVRLEFSESLAPGAVATRLLGAEFPGVEFECAAGVAETLVLQT